MQEWMFAWCHKINDLLNTKQEKKARDELIKLLARLEQENIQYSPIVNHLIRETGLYPYMKEEFADWEDKFVCEAFKINVGSSEEKILHREQSLLLKKLIDGKNIAVSAPTSFGKSFIIDAFISLKNPDNVVIIVPTIALADETRRRLYKKFANKFKIITTSDVDLAEKNIFIFPQERALGYYNKINDIDILIIDEFYKADISYDKERSSILLKVILELEKKAKQKYFLAPNISEIKENPITKDMDIIRLDFNTVFLEIHEVYKKIPMLTDELKATALLNIIRDLTSKSLIYAGTFSNIDKITTILKENTPDKSSSILNNFSDWLKINYLDTYILSDLVKKGIGIHNGKLHRSLSQIQVRLFEDENGLDKMISTSSIIEGVNTSAENVIIWANKNGGANLNNFTYKNIIGRGGRMFKHFIGKIYLLDCPPAQEPALLELKFSDEFIVSMNKDLLDLSDEQNEKVQAFKNEMNQILGSGVYEKAVEENIFQTFNPNKLKQIAIDMQQNISSWNGLAYLNSDNPDDWTNILYKVLKIMGKTSASYTAMVDYIRKISKNWQRSIPEIIYCLRWHNINVEKFFEMEREVSFQISAIINDINFLFNNIAHKHVDVSAFSTKLSFAFLPKNVYELEEYGVPRMLSKKIHSKGIIDLENNDIPLHDIILQFNKVGLTTIKEKLGSDLHPFENYILDYFYDGITTY